MATIFGWFHDILLGRHNSHERGGSPALPSSVIVSTDKSSSVFDNLCDEMLVEVLQRLPLKSVHRCKCVIKRWLNLISSNHFADCYGRYQSSCAVMIKNPPFALLYPFSLDQVWVIPSHQLGLHLTPPEEDPLSNSPGFSVNFLPPLPSPSAIGCPSKNPRRILASDKGLVLCCATSIFQSQYYVCDPINKHWVALPPHLSCTRFVRVGIVCKDNDNGGGRSFRVVRFPGESVWFPDEVERRSSSALKLEIFCSETGIWSQSVLELHTRQLLKKLVGCPLNSSAVVCNGMLHWRSYSKLFVYDPYTGKPYLNISLPKGKDRADQHHLGECQGRVRYTESKTTLFTFNVWELQDYDNEEEGGGGWRLVYKVGMGQMVSETPWIVEYIKRSNIGLLILAFHPFDGEIVFLELKWHHLVLCNLRNQTLELVCGGLVPDSWSSRPMPKAFPIVLPWWPTPISAAFTPQSGQ